MTGSVAAYVLGDERVPVGQLPAVRLAEPAAMLPKGRSLHIAGRPSRQQAAQMARDELDAAQPAAAGFRATPGPYQPASGGAVADEGDRPLLSARWEVWLAPCTAATDGRLQEPCREQFDDRRFQVGGL